MIGQNLAIGSACCGVGGSHVAQLFRCIFLHALRSRISMCNILRLGGDEVYPRPLADSILCFFLVSLFSSHIRII